MKCIKYFNKFSIIIKVISKELKQKSLIINIVSNLFYTVSTPMFLNLNLEFPNLRIFKIFDLRTT